MDKPVSMPVKEYLMRIMSLRMNIPLKTIEAVVEHQFQEAYNSMQGLDNTVEISGFGKFIFNKNKALKKWEKNIMKRDFYIKELENPELSEAKRKSYENKLKNTIDWIEHIKPKLFNESQRDIGRVEEQSDSPRGIEDNNREDIRREDGDMQGM